MSLDPFKIRDHRQRMTDNAARADTVLRARPLPLTEDSHQWRHAANLLSSCAKTLARADGCTDIHYEIGRAATLLDYLQSALALPYAQQRDAVDLDTPT